MITTNTPSTTQRVVFLVRCGSLILSLAQVAFVDVVVAAIVLVVVVILTSSSIAEKPFVFLSATFVCRRVGVKEYFLDDNQPTTIRTRTKVLRQSSFIDPKNSKNGIFAQHRSPPPLLVAKELLQTVYSFNGSRDMSTFGRGGNRSTRR